MNTGGMSVTGGMMEATGGSDVATGGVMAMEDASMPVETGGTQDMQQTDASVAAPKGPCSQASSVPGCDDPLIEQCVCAGAGGDVCCTTAWDAICVGLVQGLSCKGDCCKATGAVGCADSAVETSVCAVDATCCQKTDTSTGMGGWVDWCTILAEGNGACM